jgi:hypothetical protein
MVIIGIHGKARSGKTTAANYLVDCHGFMRMSFGDSLKEAANMIFGIPMAELYSDKKSPFVRDVLQKLGTDCCRTLDPDVWVKSMERKLADLNTYKPDSRVIIDDVRFFNEASMLKYAWQASVIKLKTGHEDDLTTEEQKKHQSEVDMDNVPESFFTAMYTNSGTKNELYQFMDTVMMLSRGKHL